MRQVPALVLELDGHPGTVRTARRATDAFLSDLARRGPPLTARTRADVVLVVSELVTNACLHAPGPCRLTVVRPRRGVVDVVVEDSLPALLVVPRHGPMGYGLLVVAGLSRGIHVVPTASGKAVHSAVVEH